MPFDGTNFEKPDDTLNVLRRARERVAQPGAWCQGDIAIGKAACAIGWLWFEGYGHVGPASKALFDELPLRWRNLADSGHSMHLIVGGYNDAYERTQADIVELFDRAIARRKAELQAGSMKP